MIFTLMTVGAAGVVVVWRLVAAERVSVWAGQGVLFGGAGLAALATGRVNLSPRVGWMWALLAGIGSGVALYLATAEFVRVVRRWPPRCGAPAAADGGRRCAVGKRAVVSAVGKRGRVSAGGACP